jgi:D-beta-D-heptose 7-phosphate kinase/D-beta-D-heptose 1-phosphate adenosyltransferase
MSADAVEVYDITGAGDTFVSVFGACLAAGGGFEEATRWANRAAGIAVARFGTTSVKLHDLLLTGSWSERIVPLRDIEMIATRLREAGKRTVFTNGCFDLLHAGHLRTLEQAGELGDVLIVGLNSDESVRRLKGPGRPFISQADRARLLASFECVHYVVVFEDDTPERLIKSVRPDVLAKGADYTVDQVVGREFVEGYGGRVELIDLVADMSTTRLIERIRGNVA